MKRWVYVLIELSLVVRLCFGVVPTDECHCGYGGMCLKNQLGVVETPCGQLCEKISGGFYKNCSQIIDYCASSPCPSGSQCVSTWGSFFCKCPKNYYGQRCEIHAPSFRQYGIDSIEVYVYYQVQPKSDGTNMFHIVYISRGSFVIRDNDDDDDDEDAPGGVKLRLNVTLSDGRAFYPSKGGKFMHKEIIKSRCFREVASNYELYDRRICNLIPFGRVAVFSFDSTFYEGYYDKRLTTQVELPNLNASGVAGTVLVQALLIDQDGTPHTVFNESYKIFTYARYRIPHNCFWPIRFIHWKRHTPRIGDITYPGQTVQISNETKYLGVILDSKLTWKPHMDWKYKKQFLAFSVHVWFVI